MRYTLAALGVTIALSPVVTSTAHPQSVSPSVDAAVYTAAPDSLFPRDIRGGRVIALFDSTQPPLFGSTERMRRALASVPGIDSATIADVIRRNELSLDLRVRAPRTARTLVLWTASDATRRDFPDSYGSTWVSAIGYSRAGDHAVLFVETVCGGLCGSGEVVFLKRDSDRWRVVHTARIWIS